MEGHSRGDGVGPFAPSLILRWDLGLSRGGHQLQLASSLPPLWLLSPRDGGLDLNRPGSNCGNDDCEVDHDPAENQPTEMANRVLIDFVVLARVITCFFHFSQPLDRHRAYLAPHNLRNLVGQSLGVHDVMACSNLCGDTPVNSASA